MPLLDFTEIPEANAGGGQQDAFELFARDLLAHLGFAIVSGPDRGPDGGRDLIVREQRSGVSGTTNVDWLVTCKHKAHSGQAVGVAEEPDLLDRVRRHKANGIIAVYSTLPAAGLTQKLEALARAEDLNHLVYDRERIEGKLLESPAGRMIARRYMPKSFAAAEIQHPRPAPILWETDKLLCQVCEKDLLDPPSGIVVFWRTKPENGDQDALYSHVVRVGWCCKGECDRRLNVQGLPAGVVDGWEDIPDVCMPSVYLRWVMATMNQLRGTRTYSDAAFEQLKEFLVVTFPYVARHPTDDERRRFHQLVGIPSEFGGFG